MTDPTSPRLTDLLALRARVDAAIAHERAALGVSAQWTALEAAADLYGVTVDEMRSASREKQTTRARQVACWLMRQHGMTLHAIGEAVHRDHTTVVASVRAVESRPEVRALACGLLGEREAAS